MRSGDSSEHVALSACLRFLYSFWMASLTFAQLIICTDFQHDNPVTHSHNGNFCSMVDVHHLTVVRLDVQQQRKERIVMGPMGP